MESRDQAQTALVLPGGDGGVNGNGGGGQVPLLPDLAFTRFDASVVKQTINVGVINRGQAPAVTVQLDLTLRRPGTMSSRTARVLLANELLPNFQTGRSFSPSMDLGWTLQPGDVLTATIDPRNRIQESNENNNTMRIIAFA